MSPQAGEPGSAPLPKVPKGFGMDKPEASEASAGASKSPAKAAKNLPVVSGGTASGIKRGLDLLREDFLKNAPERAGVGRQDRDALTMKPVAGEPGYKPPSIATVKVSALGISPFSDDKNYVSNVGGVEAVKQAAIDSKAGKSAKQLKKEVMDALNKNSSIVANNKVSQTTNFKPPASTPSAFTPTPVPAPPKAPDDLLPSYLRPIPEDTPRKGMTWKNYEGR